MDNNFMIPVDVSRLENERMKLVPFIPFTQGSERLWAQYHQECNVDHPEMWKYVGFGPFPTQDVFTDNLAKLHYSPLPPRGSFKETKNVYEKALGTSDINTRVFAIMLKAGQLHRKNQETGEMETIEVEDGTFAGATGLILCEPENSCVEIGGLMIIPRFQGCHVSTYANGLLIKHVLDPIDGGDLGMRRIQWQTNSMNVASRKAAEKLGFKLEGILRWRKIIADLKVEPPLSAEVKEHLPMKDKTGTKLGPGRHDAMYGLCWDDWLEGGREHVLGLLKT